MFVDIKTPDLVADKIQDISYFNSQNYIKKYFFQKLYSIMYISYFIACLYYTVYTLTTELGKVSMAIF